MYLGLSRPLPYLPPWEVPRETRRAWYRQGSRRIAYVYERADTSTFRYRIFNMVQALLARPEHGVSASWFTHDDFHDLSFVDDADVVVVCRARYEDGLARLVARAKGRGIPVLYDVDDLVFDPAYVHFIVDALDVPMTEQHWNDWFAAIGRLSATLDLCDGALVTTGPLRDRMEVRRPGIPCEVVPNFLNRRQSEVSAGVVAAKRARSYARREPFTVGYLSGSPTHNRDLLVASPALAAVMGRHPELRLRIVGYIELNGYLEPFAHRVERVPLQDYLNLQRLTGECEVCIAPLRLTSFARCKSELKFFEAGAVECPVVATPTPAFAGAIADGVNGFLARTDEWEDKIEEVLALASGAGEGLGALSRAASEATARYAWDAQAPGILRAIDAVCAGIEGVGRWRPLLGS